jgi:pimeloyl-ACP methyl ester carboxylesterase
MNRLRLFKWIKIAFLVYIVLGAAVYLLQDYILFRPEPLLKSHAYGFTMAHKEINIPVDNTSNLNIIQFTTTFSKPKGVVLYFHGNKKNISWYARYSINFTSKGYEVWMIDYPGYGKSTGKFTEQRLYDYALLLYTLARKTYSADSIIIYGKSMGTGIASQLASTRYGKRLILETPYYSMHSLMSHYLPVYPISRMIHYRLPTFEYLQKAIMPVTIFHGDEDGIIPYRNAKNLKNVLKAKDEFVTIEGGGHNTLNDFPEFHRKLDSVLNLPN